MTKIIIIPNLILRQKSIPAEINTETKTLVKQLKETLMAEEGTIKGVGLAAVQIGIPKKIFLAYSKKSNKLLTFINPQITWYSKSKTKGIPDSKNKYEGCLSLPNKWGLVCRAKAIKITYQSESGIIQSRKFADQIATIIQHEYDHLWGILFIDRILEQKGKIYELAKDENDKEYLKEIKI